MNTQYKTVADHLLSRHRITPGAAMIEYSIFRLAHVIHRLRTTHADLVNGRKINTHVKTASNGRKYAEYILEPAWNKIAANAAAAAEKLKASAARGGPYSDEESV